ncbi:MAG: hypothetical protein AAF580_04325 [Pseudomonadota bacterium]
MTRRTLKRWVLLVVGIYTASVTLGVAIKFYFPGKFDLVYTTFRDLIPFFLAAPAAWLGYCFSRRTTFLNQIRPLWTHVCSAVQDAIQYTKKTKTTRAEHLSVMYSLSLAIDEVRASFKNIDERNGSRGLYPFDDPKKIHDEIEELGFGILDQTAAENCQENMVMHWKNVRGPFLSEFEREEPTQPSSH